MPLILFLLALTVRLPHRRKAGQLKQSVLRPACLRVQAKKAAWLKTTARLDG